MERRLGYSTQRRTDGGLAQRSTAAQLAEGGGVTFDRRKGMNKSGSGLCQ
jgi:hypothetical protein